MRLRAPIVATALLVSAVALVWLVRNDPASPVPEIVALPPAATSAGDTRPSDEERLVLPPTPQERVANTAVAPPEVQRSPLPGEAPTTPLLELMERQRALRQPEPPGLAQEFPRIQPQLEESERAFGAEPIDESWAPGAEANVLGKISVINGLELLDLRVECRSTMCRLQTSQPGGKDATPFSDVLGATGMQPQWVMSLAGRGTGSLNTVAYLWREGYAPARPGMRYEASPDADDQSPRQD